MKPPGFLEKIDDAINPIVVKELRQAVHSRFVVAVVLLFLIIQIVYLGIHLTYIGLSGQLERVDYQAGRDVFTALQVILLATCMLFLPAYTGARLAAERSEVNTDLLFITTLQPRKIISGKLASSVLIAIMIFSACAPFMAFTYFLRGVDLPAIFLIIGGDFLVVIGSVHLMVFLAVIPSNRVLKAFLGVIGFAILVFIFSMTLGLSVSGIQWGLAPFMEDRDFWVVCGCALIGYAGLCGLLYSWSVGLICAPSANRMLPMRAYMLGYTLVSFGLNTWLSRIANHEGPMVTWVLSTSILIFLCLIISVNERERWSPRVSRTIPRNVLLRLPAFLLYSGAAGGLLFAGLLMGIMAIGVWIFQAWSIAPAFSGINVTQMLFSMFGIALLYTYCYSMTAVLVRSWLFPHISPAFNWVITIFLLAAGSLVPFLISALIFMGSWEYREQFSWLLGNPGAAMIEFADTRVSLHQDAFLIFATAWAMLVTVLNLWWFARQVARFRPFDASTAVTLNVPAGDGSSATMPLSR